MLLLSPYCHCEITLEVVCEPEEAKQNKVSVYLAGVIFAIPSNPMTHHRQY